jgi:outer membrane protein
MRTFHRVMLLSAAAVIMLSAAASTVNAQAIKIGYIDDERIKLEYKDWQRAQEQWQVEQKAWDDAAQTKQTELETMIADYDKQKLILSEEKKQERETAIRSKRDSLDLYTRTIYSPGGTAERKQLELIGPLLENINKAIEAVAIEGGYDMIFSLAQSGLGYIKPEYDVTDKVLAQIDKIDK